MAALDNDDDFDWEAAVKEIDTACEISSANPDTIFENAEAVVMPKSNPNPNLKRKQSTLDRFVDSFTKRRNEIGGSSKDCNFKKPDIDCAGVDNTGAEGGESEVKIDLDAAQTWVYPDNISRRDYQFSIAKVALFSNTLVAVPTGLGKTLIAAVVMYNYFRWFPEGKIVFTAPSRPLVIQQIEACHNIVGITQDWTIDMTGLMTPMKRSGFWTSKRVFFVTPQVLEKDIQSGICPVKQIVCLVIDEAHRALGNYAYCVAVRELMAVPVHLRILALTATPGSKTQAVQNVINNLCISTLEYRNENDSDVRKYVHSRSLEVIEVEMGKDATDINSLLFEVIQPFATRLYSYGLLHNRDFATLSPYGLLSLKEKFNNAPPSRLEPDMFQDLNKHFGLLISLYHIRKLLSSHGIRPAYEMLVDKLHSWRMYLSKNETFMQVKMLMEQSMSRGTPNPKLVKLIQILAEHFKVKDPNVSRVIIFSNFRESVKDIMGSLATMGDLVKAAEFIGQSSGKKTLKGQTQKVQQAVLQKFRTGEYNIIVATCIGEEGLDIVEVDLVICFDANISPLRMIQRMGRTGRKNDGRVVILACEGSEIKAYRKKQASGKTIIKHMNNGGIKSFNFHSSPRMVPHVCKPQAKFVKFTIEQYVPRGRKVKDDDSMHKSPVSKQLSDNEKIIIRKYFGLAQEDTWKPSLIAFPSFQTFPSRVYELKHSFRTTMMLIDAMQNLQLEKMGSTLMKVEATNHSPEIIVDAVDNNKQDIHTATTFQETSIMIEEKSIRKTPHAGCNTHKFSSHCFLYGEDYVTITSLGGVLITSVPRLPNRKHAVSEVLPSESSKKTSSGKFIKDEEEIAVLETPISKQKEIYQENTVCHKAVNTRNTKDVKLSPRLTYFIEEGIVPESPIANNNNASSPQFAPTHQKFVALTQPKSVGKKAEILCSLKDDSLASPDIMKFSDVSPEKFIRRDKWDVKIKRNIVFFPDNKDVHNPLVNSTNNNSSEDWQQNSEDASKLSQPPPKYRRLRKFEDIAKQIRCQTPQLKGELNEGRREKKRKPARFNSFIDEEAEVSQDAKVSEDEEFGEREDDSQYEDSFIDDRQQHTVASTASTEVETGDMMAFYRRSLLTQSPVAFMNNNSVTTPHESLLSKSSENECSSSGKLQNRLETPNSGSCSVSHQHKSDTDETSVTCENSTTTSFNKLDSRKRKLSYQQLTSITPIKLPLENIPEIEDSNKAMPLNDDLGDDFFDCIDLDAIEEEATKLLRNKSGRSSQGKDVNLDVMCSPPTFDLGI